ncbi:MAG TPA: family 10 glycosylhydrolase [Thermoanaerobaculia bacterium]|nr:family 10 glycosylhydrolase [Thermoanaerobaculia bacterium]
MRRLLVLMLLILPAACATGSRSDAPPPPPEIPREFRGVWVATVKNIDWPSRPGLTKEQQQRELATILDRARDLRLNAVLLQVRPEGDALYRSRIEPWSEVLTGRMGGDPGWDPLAWAIDQAHSRGLEIHAWLNPYRARHRAPLSPAVAPHISVTHPHLVREYGGYLWMDPGEPEVRERMRAVVADIVRRYDVDGIHLDDYFYPYPESDAAGAAVEFPDDASWSRYRAAGGVLDRSAWRRENVDQLIRGLYEDVKRLDPHVRFGVAPFGIWRPGHPSGIEGFDAFAGLHADAKQWLEQGWVDYLSPQLYWPMEGPQSFRKLLGWWLQQNPRGRFVWPGLNVSRVANGTDRAFYPEEILEQINEAREQKAGGTILFSMKPLLQDRAGVASRLSAALYDTPALVPAMTWLDDSPPRPPLASWNALNRSISVAPGEADAPSLWTIRTLFGTTWSSHLVSGSVREIPLQAEPDAILVTAVDRAGNESEVAAIAPRPRR